MKPLSRLSDFFATHRVLYVYLYILSALSIVDITAAPQFKIALWMQIAYVSAISALKASALMLPLAWAWKYRAGRILARTCLLIYTILAAVNATSFMFYGFGITRKLLIIAAQTTPMELREFLPGLASNICNGLRSPWLWAAVMFVYALFRLVSRCRTVLYLRAVAIASAIGLCAFAVYSLIYTSGRTAHSIAFRMAKYGYEIVLWNRHYEQLLAMKRELPFTDSVSSKHLASTVVVVIGESASRSHLSLYGYPLPTTPRIDSIRDRLCIFTNAIGSSTSTSGNMERILSLKTDDTTSGDGLEYPLLIDLFNAAGYKTFWLSNQERTGSISNTSGVMAAKASVIKYAGAEFSEDALAVRFDEVLLPELSAAVTDTSAYKLIFLHLLGSHTEYRNRYPSSFNKFDANHEFSLGNRPWLDRDMATRVAAYDNSILYTDHILKEVLDKLDSTAEPAVMLYFSDHGENVYDEGSYCGRGEAYVQVPFFMYANTAYKSANDSIDILMRNAVARPFSTANIVHSILTLTGTTYRLYSPENDVLSPCFRPHPRYVDEQIWKYEGIK